MISWVVGDSMIKYVVMLEDDSGLEVRELKTTRKDLAELERFLRENL